MNSNKRITADINPGMGMYSPSIKCAQIVSIIVFLITLASFKTQAKSHYNTKDYGKIIINIHYREAKANDTLSLILDNILLRTNDRDTTRIYKRTGKNGWFRFSIPVKESVGYFDISKARTFSDDGGGGNAMHLLIRNFWEKGDSVTVDVSNREMYAGVYSKCVFSGKGFEKYRARYLTDSAMNTGTSISKPAFDKDMNYYDPYENRIKRTLAILDNARTGLSPISYQVLRSDILFDSGRGRFSLIYTYNRSIQSAPDSVRQNFISKYMALFKNPNTFNIPVEALANSQQYLFYMYQKYIIETYLVTGKYDADWIYHQMKENLEGNIREKVITIFFLNSKKSDHVDDFYSDAKTFFTDPLCLKELNNLIVNVPGRMFSNFSLPDDKGKIVTLSNYRGKVVLLDFWFNGCGGCTVFYKSALSVVEEEFKDDPNVVFISVNGDRSEQRWVAGINSGQYTSKNAINVFTAGLGDKHPLVVENNITPFPFVILLDKNGAIKYFNSNNLYDPKDLAAAIHSVK